MGEKVKGWHNKRPGQSAGQGSKVLRDAITSGPKAGPHADKREKRQRRHTIPKSEMEW